MAIPDDADEQPEIRFDVNGHLLVARFADDHWEVSECLRCGALDPRVPCNDSATA